MVRATLVVATSFLVQAAAALVLALLLLGFHRTYRRDYLRQWAWSWWALCVYLLASGLSVYLRGVTAPLAPLRLALSGIAQVAGYWEVAWLLFGTWEVVTGRTLGARLRRGVLWGLLGLALASLLLTLPASPEVRFLGRFGLRSLLASVAFLAAGAGVLRRGRQRVSTGRRLVGVAFLLYSARLLEYVAAPVLVSVFGIDLQYSALLGPLDLLLQSLIGLGLVIWLLEEERHRTEQTSQQLAHLAYHDPLTGLPNRNQFVDVLRRAIDGPPAGGHLAIAYLDLDRFKLFNESLGHAAGDRLLSGAALRLRNSVQPSQTVARLIGDELAVLLTGFASTPELQHAVERLLVVLRQPFTLAGQLLHVTASAGLARFPEDGAEPELLLRKAELAMYRAKEYGRDLYLLYAPSMDRRAVEQLALEGDLRRALAGHELELHFQPVFAAAAPRIDAVEALVRWRHPERGLLQPGDFLWLADAAGLSEPLDLEVLRSACRTLRRWQEAGVRTRVAVNFSARTFGAADLLDQVRAALDECGLAPAALEIEITETLAMQNAEASAAVLADLKGLGVGITIDDFGTGYSSLAYLRRFPIDTLKVDASFVRLLASDPPSARIVAAVVALAHSLGLAVVAEGVEEEAQWRILRDQGCDRVQGHLFGAPLPADQCLELLRSPILPLAMGR